MKLFRIMILSICVTSPFVHAGDEDVYHFDMNNNTRIDLPSNFFSNTIKQISSIFSKEIADTAPQVITQASAAGAVLIQQGAQASDAFLEKSVQFGDQFITKSVGAGDQFIAKTSIASTVLVSQLTHNLAWIFGGTIVGGIGGCLCYQGLNDLLDNEKSKKPDNTFYAMAKTTLGIATMAAAGLTVHAFIK